MALKPNDRKALRKNLRQAVADHDLAGLKKLIATHGSDVFAYYGTLLHYACYAGREDHPDTVRLLIESGADPEARNTAGAAPLHIACFNGRIDSVNTLLDAGADVEAMDLNDLTPFDDICQSRADVFDETFVRVGDILLSNGADIDSLTSGYETNLHYACRNLRTNVVHFLLSRGADPTICNLLDKTPLDTAIDLPQDNPEREVILDLFREFHPELYFSKFCTMPMSLSPGN